jgi:uncharacterized protein (TIGR02996 family)
MATILPSGMIAVERRPDALIAHVQKRMFPIVGEPDLVRDQLVNLGRQARDRRLWVDFNRVDAMSAVSNGTLLTAQRRLAEEGIGMILANLSPTIRELFEVLRFDRVLDIRDGLPEDPPFRPSPMESAFLASIGDEPEDDAPRLIFADWLEEHGDSDRSDFIRAQVERARLAATDPRHAPLLQREQDLLDRHGREWARPVRPFVQSWEFRRGVIERATLSVTALSDHGRELAFSTPIRELNLHSVWRQSLPPLPVLLDWPGLSRLTHLSLALLRIENGGTFTLAHCEALSGLVFLDLSSNDLTDTAAQTLTRSPVLTRLKTLDVRGNRFTDWGRDLLRSRFGDGVVV